MNNKTWWKITFAYAIKPISKELFAELIKMNKKVEENLRVKKIKQRQVYMIKTKKIY